MLSSHSFRLVAFSLLFFVFPLCWTKQNGPCPLLGPDVPAPTSPSSSNAIRQAKQDLTQRLNQALHTATAYGKLDAETNSFALNVWSLHEPDTLYNYSHIGTALPRPSSGVSTIDEDTILRIGSLSKLFTVYTYLMTAGDLSWNDPITKYIPELEAYMAKNKGALEAGDAIDVIQWDQITIGALAGQLGGVPREFAFGPDVDAQLQQAIGLPAVSPVKAAFCGSPQELQAPCNRSGEFLFLFPFA
jgi:CubicO group peptidase (beta-lactamase class C family)